MVISFSKLGINRLGISVLLVCVRKQKGLVTSELVRPETNDSTRNYPGKRLTCLVTSEMVRLETNGSTRNYPGKKLTSNFTTQVHTTITYEENS